MNRKNIIIWSVFLAFFALILGSVEAHTVNSNCTTTASCGTSKQGKDCCPEQTAACCPAGSADQDNCCEKDAACCPSDAADPKCCPAKSEGKDSKKDSVDKPEKL